MSSVRTVELTLNLSQLTAPAIIDLRQLFAKFQPTNGQKSVSLHLRCQHTSATAVLQCGDNWRIYPHDDLIKRLKQWYGNTALRLVYQ